MCGSHLWSVIEYRDHITAAATGATSSKVGSLLMCTVSEVPYVTTDM